MTDHPVQEPAVEKATSLVTAWADFTKSYGLYPETNVRIRNYLERLMTQIEEMTEGNRMLAVTLHQEHVVVGGVLLEGKAGLNVEWLRDRLDQAALAGLAFMPGVTGESVVEFTRRLHAHGRRRERALPLDELFPDPVPGLQLLDRRFDGVRGGAEVAGGEATTRGIWATGLWSLDTVQGRTLVELLENSGEVEERLEKLREAVTARKPLLVSDRTARVDLVSQIVNVLPADVLRKPAEVVSITSKIIDGLLEELEHPSASAEDLEQGRMDRLMLSIARRYFFDDYFETKETDEPQAPSEAPTARRNRDDEIEEDLEALLSEVALLPSRDDAAYMKEGVELAEEQLAVYLRCLLHLESREAESGLQQHLRRILSKPDPGQLACLLKFLEYAEQVDAENGEHDRLDRLLGFLEGSQLLDIVDDSGFLTADRVQRCFPRLFLTYVRTRDWSSQKDVDELEGLCKQLGPEAIIRSSEELRMYGGLTENGVGEQLLAHPSRHLLPLVAVLLEETEALPRAALVSFLRTAAGEVEEACLLSVHPEPERLPIQYFRSLSRSASLQTQDRDLRWLVASSLCDTVRALKGDEGAIHVRLRAIQHLTAFDGSKTRTVLNEILNSRRWFGLHREPAAIRGAAHHALRKMKES